MTREELLKEPRCLVLHSAIKAAMHRAIPALVSAGAEVNWCDASGRNSLFIARQYKYKEAISLLKELGAEE